MRNKKVVLLSIVALGFVALGYLEGWYFMIPAIVIIWLNKRELKGKN